MKRNKLEKLLNIVLKEKKLAEVRYKENKEAFDQALETTKSSWSAAGDRVYAESQEVLNKNNLETITNLVGELKSATQEAPPETIKAPCYVEVDINGEKDEFFITENVANIKNTKIVSLNSPLGKALLKKSVSDNVELLVGENKTKVEVLSIQ